MATRTFWLVAATALASVLAFVPARADEPVPADSSDAPELAPLGKIFPELWRLPTTVTSLRLAESFSQRLANELKNNSVTVTWVIPPPV